MRAAGAIAEQRPGTVAVAVITPDGQQFGLRAHRPVATASLLKTTLLLGYLGQPRVRDRRLAGQEQRRLGAMIRRSDDRATEQILRRLTAQTVAQAPRRSGQRAFHFNSRVWGASRTTARDQARLMITIEHALPRRHRAYGMRLLRTVAKPQRWGLAVAAPQGTRIWFKGGWGSGTGRVAHQAARLDTGGRIWSVAVMTTDSPSHAVAVSTVERIGRVVLGDGPC